MIAEATTGSASADTLIAWSAGGTVVVGAVVMLWRIISRVASRLEEFLEDWNGAPPRPGVPARPGMMERMGRMEVAVCDIRHELHLNSGGSLRDVVDRVESAVSPPGPPCA